MTGLPDNVEDLLSRLKETSKSELTHVRRLAEAIRHADTQLLEEVRSITLMHEVRREAIFGELQHLAHRLCALPVRDIGRDGVREPMVQIDQPQPPVREPLIVEPDAEPTTGAGDWRQATKRIDEELDDFFDRNGARH